MIKGLENLPREAIKGVRSLLLREGSRVTFSSPWRNAQIPFSLEKRRLKRDLITVFPYLKSGFKENRGESQGATWIR